MIVYIENLKESNIINELFELVNKFNKVTG